MLAVATGQGVGMRPTLAPCGRAPLPYSGRARRANARDRVLAAFGLSRPFSLRDRLAEAEAVPFRQPGIHSDGLRLLLHRKLVSQCLWGGVTTSSSSSSSHRREAVGL